MNMKKNLKSVFGLDMLNALLLYIGVFIMISEETIYGLPISILAIIIDSLKREMRDWISSEYARHKKEQTNDK